MWISNRKEKDFREKFQKVIDVDDAKQLESLFKEYEIKDVSKDLGKIFHHPKSLCFVSITCYALYCEAEHCLDLIKSLGHKFKNDDICEAVRKCSFRIIKKYCDGISPEDYQNPFYSIECSAAKRGDLEIIKYIHSLGFSFQKNKHGNMPILDSARNGNVECFKFISEVVNFAEYDINDFTKVAKEAKSEILDFMYDTYSDETHREALKPFILSGDALSSYIKVYGTTEVDKENMIKLAKSDSHKILSYINENHIKSYELSFEELSTCYCPESILELTKNRYKDAYLYLVQKQCFANCAKLLDVIELTPKERGLSIQQFVLEQLSPYNDETPEFNRKILQGDSEIEGTDAFLYMLGHCYYVPENIAREFKLFERYSHTPKEYYDNARGKIACVKLMLKFGYDISDLIDQNFIKNLVQTEIRQNEVEPIIKQMKDPKQCLLWTIGESDDTAFTYREIIYGFLSVHPELRYDNDVIKAVQHCKAGWDSTPLFMEFKVGICDSLIEFFKREHESPMDYEYVFKCLTNDEKTEVLFRCNYFSTKILEWAEPSLRFKGESLMHSILRRKEKYMLYHYVQDKKADLSFAENDGDDPIVFEILKSEFAPMVKDMLLERDDLLGLTNHEGKTVNEILDGIESKPLF
ncbi:hypothetical protein GPJ56_000629 [Histomonas meleagridis]|uniref:uncharacterized protein n=1 Tax=Histomonas meleagridis TaxID=135588 RepID=UPI003559CF73|nr:hypothetical protein GPJ56_000629 [Histomonas meleagridis]KAH0804756.1 hypothetical protein GO595_002450 [Histomonas meleagridis]